MPGCMTRVLLCVAVVMLVDVASAMSLRACEQQRCEAHAIAPCCATDGIRYANECAFQVARCEDTALRIASAGECAPNEWRRVEGGRAQCERPCTREYIPLCGSDGVTYANKCTFRNAQRCKYHAGRPLWIAKHSAC